MSHFLASNPRPFNVRLVLFLYFLDKHEQTDSTNTTTHAYAVCPWLTISLSQNHHYNLLKVEILCSLYAVGTSPLSMAYDFLL